jgi:hypothetical protein
MIPSGACKHGLLYCPVCLGSRNPVQLENIRAKRKAGPMKDRRKRRQKDKARRDLQREVSDAVRG